MRAIWLISVVVLIALSAVAVSVWDGDASPPSPNGPPSELTDPGGRRPILGISEPNAWRTSPPLASPEQIARLVASVGATSQRFVVDWNVAEPLPPDGARDYDFGPFDAMYEAAVGQGIRPLLVVLNAPPWAADPLTGRGSPFNNPPASSRLGDWQAFLDTVTRRYPRALGIEIWNEPNLATFWGAGSAAVRPDPERYAVLLRSSYEAIKAANPRMLVVGGALAPGTSGGANIPATDFARALFAMGGANYMDALSLHPYPGAVGVARTVAVVDEIRSVRSYFAEIPLWLTEVGVTTTGPYAVSERTQASSLASICRALSGRDDIDAVYVHTLLDRPGSAGSPEPGYGVVRSAAGGTLSPKPSLAALRRAFSRRRGCAAPG